MKTSCSICSSLAILLLLFCLSCKKDNNENNPYTPKQDVYVAGTINDRAAFWKNGIANELEDTAASNWSYGICIYPTGNDVYVCGATKINDIRYGVYWKNGVANYLRKDSSCYASSIAASGNDVYVTGGMIYNRPDLNPNYTKAVYWKNGDMFYLSKDSSEAIHIAIAGSDVYIAGDEIVDGIHKAVLWKNGVAIYLSDPAIDSYAADVSVVGDDVYVGGTEHINGDYVAVYWKNGILYSTQQLFQVQAMYVSGSDVYMTGFNLSASDASGYYLYGKDGLTTKLPDIYNISSICVSGSDVYMALIKYDTNPAPYGGNYAALWKNGVSIRLSSTYSSAYSVVVR